MKTILETSEWPAALARYKGATAHLWLFQVSLRRLLIRLSMPGLKESLFITGVGCEHIVSAFSWENASIVIHDYSGPTRITDQRAGFELLCHGSALVLATEDEDMQELWGTQDMSRLPEDKSSN